MFQLDLPLGRTSSANGNYVISRDGIGSPILLYCGDKDSLKCFQLGDIGSAAKQPEPLWSAQLSNTVHLVALSKSAKNKIFCVSGSEVHAYTRKGKPFFAFDSNLTEQLLFLHVVDESIYLATDHLVVHYSNGNEDWTFINSNGDISNMQIVKSSTSWLAVVHGSDGAVKIVDKGNVLQQITSSTLNSAPIAYISTYEQDSGALLIGYKGHAFSVLRETAGTYKQVSTISCDKLAAVNSVATINDEQGNIMFICFGNGELRCICLFSGGFKQYADIELPSGVQESQTVGTVCVYKSASGNVYVHDFSVAKTKVSKMDILEQIKQLTQECATLNREFETLRAKPATETATLPQIVIKKSIEYEGDCIKCSLHSNYQINRLYVDIVPELKLKSSSRPIQSLMQRDQDILPPQTLHLLTCQKQDASFEVYSFFEFYHIICNSKLMDLVG